MFTFLLIIKAEAITRLIIFLFLRSQSLQRLLGGYSMFISALIAIVKAIRRLFNVHFCAYNYSKSL
jgi:hypothetical protein